MSGANQRTLACFGGILRRWSFYKFTMNVSDTNPVGPMQVLRPNAAPAVRLLQSTRRAAVAVVSVNPRSGSTCNLLRALWQCSCSAGAFDSVVCLKHAVCARNLDRSELGDMPPPKAGRVVSELEPARTLVDCLARTAAQAWIPACGPLVWLAAEPTCGLARNQLGLRR